jgi:quercetin dioxygenase-like cupin family protein
MVACTGGGMQDAALSAREDDMTKLSIVALAFGVLIAAGAGPAYAQQAALKRTVLQQGDTADIPGHEVVMSLAEVPANAEIARHTHPGTELTYVLEGGGTLSVDGEPPRDLKAGDSFLVPVGKPHGGKAGPDGIKIVGIHVVEKGKPLASPAK